MPDQPEMRILPARQIRFESADASNWANVLRQAADWFESQGPNLSARVHIVYGETYFDEVGDSSHVLVFVDDCSPGVFSSE